MKVNFRIIGRRTEPFARFPHLDYQPVLKMLATTTLREARAGFVSTTAARLALGLLLTLSLLNSALVAQDSTPATDHANRGLTLAREGRLAEAEQELQEAVRAAPGAGLHRAQLGSVLGLQGKWNEALTSFQKAMELDPSDINIRRETAAVQWQLRRWPEAEKNLRFVLENRPGDPGAILLLGLVSEAKGDYAEASRLLASEFGMVISQPDRTVALFHSDFQISRRDNLPKIVEALRLHSSDSKWSEAISRCTQIAARSGDSQTAEALFALVPGNLPSRSAAGLELARLLYNLGRVEEARRLLLQLSSSEDAGIQALLGRCYQALHQPAMALAALQRAVELDPSQLAPYPDLISLQLQSGLTGDAEALANRLTSQMPNSAGAWVLKGEIELRLNAFQDALKSYSHAAGIDPSNADAVLGIASVHALSGSSEAAMAAYKNGVRRFPGDSRFYVAFAAALLSSPNAPEAYSQVKSLLLQAVKLDPQSSEGHYQLGQLALREGHLNQAKEEFLISLHSEPDRSRTHFGLSLAYRRLGQTDDAARQFAIYEKLKHAEESEAANP